jgi:hypothetical protein
MSFAGSLVGLLNDTASTASETEVTENGENYTPRLHNFVPFTNKTVPLGSDGLDTQHETLMRNLYTIFNRTIDGTGSLGLPIHGLFNDAADSIGVGRKTTSKSMF